MRKIIDDALIFIKPLISRGDPLIYGYENFESNQFNTKSIQFSERNTINNYMFENEPAIDEIWNYGIDAVGYRMTIAYHFVDGRRIGKINRAYVNWFKHNFNTTLRYIKHKRPGKNGKIPARTNWYNVWTFTTTNKHAMEEFKLLVIEAKLKN